jgi:hypothetical protein
MPFRPFSVICVIHVRSFWKLRYVERVGCAFHPLSEPNVRLCNAVKLFNRERKLTPLEYIPGILMKRTVHIQTVRLLSKPAWYKVLAVHLRKRGVLEWRMLLLCLLSDTRKNMLCLVSELTLLNRHNFKFICESLLKADSEGNCHLYKQFELSFAFLKSQLH